MKKSISLLGIAAVLLVSSCKEGNDNDGKTVIVQDSLVNVIPTWQALKVKIEDNRTEMKIIIGDPAFYALSPEEKAKKANEVAQMVLRIYGKGNYLEKGKLIVTKNARNTEEEPADGISTPLDFEGLKKQGY